MLSKSTLSSQPTFVWDEAVAIIQRLIYLYCQYCTVKMRPIIYSIFLSRIITFLFKQRLETISIITISYIGFIVLALIYTFTHLSFYIAKKIDLLDIWIITEKILNIILFLIVVVILFRWMCTPGTMILFNIDIITITIFNWNFLMSGIAVILFRGPLKVIQVFVLIYVSIISFMTRFMVDWLYKYGFLALVTAQEIFSGTKIFKKNLIHGLNYYQTPILTTQVTNSNVGSLNEDVDPRQRSTPIIEMSTENLSSKMSVISKQSIDYIIGGHVQKVDSSKSRSSTIPEQILNEKMEYGYTGLRVLRMKFFNLFREPLCTSFSSLVYYNIVMDLCFKDKYEFTLDAIILLIMITASIFIKTFVGVVYKRHIPMKTFITFISLCTNILTDHWILAESSALRPKQ